MRERERNRRPERVRVGIALSKHGPVCAVCLQPIRLESSGLPIRTRWVHSYVTVGPRHAAALFEAD